jgi:hypothetical protein
VPTYFSASIIAVLSVAGIPPTTHRMSEVLVIDNTRIAGTYSHQTDWLQTQMAT